jgi:hypothetical protein
VVTVTVAGLDMVPWALGRLTAVGIRPRQVWVIGSDPTCQIHVADDDRVAAFHALAAEDQAGAIWLFDLGPDDTWSRVAGGTWSRVIGTSNRIRPGDTVKVGRTELPWTASHERITP